MTRRFTLPYALLAFVCLALPAAADPTAPPSRPSNLRSDILYTHKGEFVQVAPMRSLTLNAHIEQFAYDPLGLEIAIVGSETSGDQTKHFVKTIDAHTGHEISRLALTAPSEDTNTSLFLLGFSTSGKYLLLQRTTGDLLDPNTSHTEYERLDLSAPSPVSLNIRPEADLPPGAVRDHQFQNGFASPDGHWIAFREDFHEPAVDGVTRPTQTTYLLYDTERNTFQPLSLPPNVSVYSWIDATHLKFWQHTARMRFDVITGEVSPETTPLDYAAPVVSKRYPDLTLDVEQRTLKDESSKESGGHIESILVWIRRTSFGTMPLGVSAAGLMPAQYNNSQAVWSPSGTQVAFIANSELYVADLIPAQGFIGKEKQAVGLKLSCEDEQIVAMSDLKQIGLGIIQYTQDNDENLPAGDGWIKTIYPYIQSMDVFQVEGHPVVYEQPAELALAKMDSPATTEQAYIDLPCARVALFGDGHVKVFPKQ